jgi:ATP-dependent Lhr-like helicase
LLEAYEQYLIIHATFGERVNRTLGAVLDAILSDHDLVYTWWNDPYRILIEAPRKLDRFDLEKVRELINSMAPGDIERKLEEFMEARFPFGYKMKFIAERFGVIPRGKTLSSQSLENLYIRFKDTPIYRETLREAHQEKLDETSTKEIVSEVASGTIEVISRVVKKPSPLARHILEKYADTEELMESTISVGDQLEYMRKSIMARKVKLACMSCGEWSATFRVRELKEKPNCDDCGSNLLAVLRRHQDPEAFLATYGRFRKGERVTKDERDLLTRSRKAADMVLSYGKRGVEALMVHGVGPVTSYQVLSKMHQEDRDFYADLLRAKIQYMKTRQYWDNR